MKHIQSTDVGNLGWMCEEHPDFGSPTIVLDKLKGFLSEDLHDKIQVSLQNVRHQREVKESPKGSFTGACVLKMDKTLIRERKIEIFNSCHVSKVTLVPTQQWHLKSCDQPQWIYGEAHCGSCRQCSKHPSSNEFQRSRTSTVHWLIQSKHQRSRLCRERHIHVWFEPSTPPKCNPLSPQLCAQQFRPHLKRTTDSPRQRLCHSWCQSSTLPNWDFKKESGSTTNHQSFAKWWCNCFHLLGTTKHPETHPRPSSFKTKKCNDDSSICKFHGSHTNCNEISSVSSPQMEDLLSKLETNKKAQQKMRKIKGSQKHLKSNLKLTQKEFIKPQMKSVRLRQDTLTKWPKSWKALMAWMLSKSKVCFWKTWHLEWHHRAASCQPSQTSKRNVAAMAPSMWIIWFSSGRWDHAWSLRILDPTTAEIEDQMACLLWTRSPCAIKQKALIELFQCQMCVRPHPVLPRPHFSQGHWMSQTTRQCMHQSWTHGKIIFLTHPFQNKICFDGSKTGTQPKCKTSGQNCERVGTF